MGGRSNLRRMPPVLLIVLLTIPSLATSLAAVADGRRVTVLKDDAAIGRHICARVAALAADAIAAKGSFAMSIGSGTTVAPLKMLAGELDFSRVHIFFGNDRTEGEAAGKCFTGAADFVASCGVPASQVHRVPSGPAEDSAAAYEALLRSLSGSVLSTCERSGLVRRRVASSNRGQAATKPPRRRCRRAAATKPPRSRRVTAAWPPRSRHVSPRGAAPNRDRHSPSARDGSLRSTWCSWAAAPTGTPRLSTQTASKCCAAATVASWCRPRARAEVGHVTGRRLERRSAPIRPCPCPCSMSTMLS